MSLFASKPKKQQQRFECHFCCQTTTAPIHYKHGWLCPDSSCAQYNGFTANGDYNLDFVQEFVSQPPNTTHRLEHRPRYCAPSRKPFPSNSPINTGLRSSTSAAPLCHSCQQNINHIQQQLRAFNAGPNSHYMAYRQHRQLLNAYYPLCDHCQTQCKHKLHAINHTAKLCQQYEDALPPNNLDAFRVQPSCESIQRQHMRKPRNNNNLRCLSLLICVIQSIIVYLSCHISMNGASALCQHYLSTPNDMLENCDIQPQDIGIRATCVDGASDDSTLCLLVHFIGNQMAPYALVTHPIWLASLSLLFLLSLLFGSTYNLDAFRGTYSRLFVVLFVMANALLIVIGLMPQPWMEFVWYSDVIYVTAQACMFLLAMLMLTCSSTAGFHRPRRREQRINEKQNSSDVLALLEQQEKLDSVQRSSPLLFDDWDAVLPSLPSASPHKKQKCAGGKTVYKTNNNYGYQNHGNQGVVTNNNTSTHFHDGIHLHHHHHHHHI